MSVYSYGHFARQVRGEAANAIPVEVDGTALDRVIAARTVEHPEGTGVALLSDDIEAFVLRALSARAAGRSLDLQYYYWRDDLTGGLLANEVIAAADRGVRVRILLDDINARGGDATYSALDSHPNIEVRLFNPAISREGDLQRGVEMLLRALTMTRRMHNKAWIADGRLAIVGGRNVGDAYFGASDTANFRDLDALLIGPTVPATAVMFDRFWNSPVVLPIGELSSRDENGLAALRRRLAALSRSAPGRLYLERLTSDVSAAASVIGDAHFDWTDTATIVFDPPEKALEVGQQGWINETIGPVIATATRKVEIISPYFIPGPEGVDLLGALVERGASVSVLTNSLAATDIAAVHGAYAPYRVPLLEKGVALYELKPDSRPRRLSLFGSSNASLHTKAFVVDGRHSFIGSFNFDPRSISLNTEMGVMFDDQTLADAVSREFSTHVEPEHSYRLGLEGGRIVWRAGAKETVRRGEPGASLWRRLVASVIGYLPLESQL